MSTLPAISLSKLQSTAHAFMLNGTQYGFGDKATSLEEPISKIHLIDCSGFVRYLVFHSTETNLVVPDGSFNIRQWVQDRAEELEHYSDVASLSTFDPGQSAMLAINFIDPTPQHSGHVWFTIAERQTTANEPTVVTTTLESYGGHGPGSRMWNARPLPQEVAYSFKWAHVA